MKVGEVLAVSFRCKPALRIHIDGDSISKIPNSSDHQGMAHTNYRNRRFGLEFLEELASRLAQTFSCFFQSLTNSFARVDLGRLVE